MLLFRAFVCDLRSPCARHWQVCDDDDEPKMIRTSGSPLDARILERQWKKGKCSAPTDCHISENCFSFVSLPHIIMAYAMGARNSLISLSTACAVPFCVRSLHSRAMLYFFCSFFPIARNDNWFCLFRFCFIFLLFRFRFHFNVSFSSAHFQFH